MKTEFNFDLTPYNSFKINAKARKFIEIEDFADYRLLKDKPSLFTEPIYILGGGYNTLFTKDYEGTVVKINNKGLKILEDNDESRTILVGAGEEWNDLVNYALQHQLYGLENLIDIPGNVGSAPIQNIGAYGVEAAESIEEVHFFDLKTGVAGKLNKEECKFGYRDSIFKKDLKGKVIISGVVFKLSKKGNVRIGYGDIQSLLSEKNIENPNLQQIAKVISEIRASKLPDPKMIGNAGSFFKNPVVEIEILNSIRINFPNVPSYPIDNQFVKIPAGWLIEQAGWKGRAFGHAAVHHKQALVLVNLTGHATGDNVQELAEEIIKDVFVKFGVRLEAEVNII